MNYKLQLAYQLFKKNSSCLSKELQVVFKSVFSKVWFSFRSSKRLVSWSSSCADANKRASTGVYITWTWNLNSNFNIANWDTLTTFVKTFEFIFSVFGWRYGCWGLLKYLEVEVLSFFNLNFRTKKGDQRYFDFNFFYKNYNLKLNFKNR